MLVLKLRKLRGQLQSLRPHFLEVRFTFGGAVLGRLQGLFQQGPLGLVLCNLGGLRRSDLGLILIDWFIQRGDYGALSFTRGRNCGGIEAKRFPPVSGNLNLISSLKCRCQHAER